MSTARLPYRAALALGEATHCGGCRLAAGTTEPALGTPGHLAKHGGALVEQLALIEPPAFLPILPTRGTLPDRLLTLLLTGECVTQPEWTTRTGSWRLAASVFELAALGWPVESLLVPAPTVANPARTIARYHLKPAAIAAGRLLRKASQ